MKLNIKTLITYSPGKNVKRYPWCTTKTFLVHQVFGQNMLSTFFVVQLTIYNEELKENTHKLFTEYEWKK